MSAGDRPASAAPLRSVAVFCGSNFGSSPAYADAATALGQALARRGIRLIYGGTNKGLMGVLADATLAAGGAAVGIINRRLYARGHLHPALTAHEVVEHMRARKARMAELADAFVALPGGLGTLEELFEAATLTQLGDQTKACGALNVLGFYDPMRAMLTHAVSAGFLKPEHRDMVLIDDAPDRLLDALQAWQPTQVSKWINQPGA
ncbi:TIGR00730 family Rossman fold protein [Ideonella azotifigens]|uniref:Cytokinin riboside 5'-monophosphate phosphoribohydrolase n=1 Tax=Ideonella azotifigens TaxID=513160 RepID=A0ABP3VEI2_9BURK|nr:TIGR00730 family Rossman fold protein [Ideonella azotifigens]MCD2344452.1 TIGR00730 family Rossman fold protein [Ideonella azotifigens]